MTLFASDVSGSDFISDAHIARQRGDVMFGIILIVVVPTLFWMGVLEGVTAAFGIEYGIPERLVAASAMILTLSVVRGCARAAKD